MRSRLTNLVAVALSVGSTLAMGCDRTPPAPPQPQTTQHAVAADTTSTGTTADQAQSLPVVRLADLQKIIADADAANQVLVIDFWATWCIPCVEMFPVLHDKLPQLGDNVKLVSVTIDSPGKYEQLAIEFLRKHHAMDNAYIMAAGENDGPLVEVIQALGKQWHDLEVPVILVYGPDGQLKDEFLRERANPGVIIPRVEAIVKESVNDSRQSTASAS